MATSTLGSGTLVLAGTTSGTTTVTATAVAGTTTLTLPAATDTLVGKATTDTLTNKTLTTPTISQLSSAAATALTLQSAGTTAVTIDTSQNVGIGTSSPTQKLHVNSAGSAIGLFQSTLAAGNTNVETRYISTNRTWGVGQNIIQTSSIFEIADITANATRLAIDSSGNLLVGTTTAAGKLTVKASGTENVGNQIANFTSATSSDGVFFFLSNGTAHGSASLPTIAVNKNTATGRSINAEGTINASGADYAEYMTKAGEFIVAKGDVVGIDAQGKLTNVFANAVSFVVKSTDPSYVGGDSWGSVDAIGKRPDVDATQAKKDAFEIVLEVARQRVDRISFAGQVPVNVTGATAGQYIIPVNDNGAIKGEAVSNPTFEQYQIAVGKVIAIEADGRAKIIVKVA